MSDAVLNKEACLAALPPDWPEELLPRIQARVRASRRKIVILDDDPTGTQTVHGLPVLTTWSVQTLKRALLTPGPGFFILTNSRSLDRTGACVLAMEIGINLQTAAELAGIATAVISRSDSTLRGHFPHEVDAVAKAMGTDARPYLILPFFPEGGRFTINNVHYVAEEEHLVPAAMTAYAKDAAFGFSSSNLKEWVAEKTAGRIPAETITAITLDDIRKGGPERVGAILAGVTDRAACIVNAVSYRDVEVLVAGLFMAGERGRQFLYRTAAAFVRVMTGIKPRADFLSRAELVADTRIGGLFVVGSYVPKTTAQVEALLEQTDIAPVEVKVANLLSAGGKEAEIEAAAALANTQLEQGRDVVLFTSRAIVTGADAKTSLDIGQVVSDSLIRIIQTVRHQPRYLVAKGGITSSDVATRGLHVRQAMIVGQIMPGVPVWQLESESRYPGMSYIVFPGNVGDDNALVAIQKKLA
ncbi:four-carbon acid sugar kinase family protein [Desulfosarcina sp.]|uniref:four-carbon acid sugar kinase family protein n=1 Tax=Desulfosarcina sp. TaxID=2027861 RepID=UPI0029A3E637|nr:four-carbon acid sugar kinase family protein [Desulfosarcina sp.]MDX2452633.1 four-carbon acid sugar kinase family protein [Desulfosarcina sp.]